MREIVTLQFGQQANYLGTHFWNTQESYFTYPPEEESPVDHDIHFRPGIAPDGSDTFTPRALIYDLKSAFGAMRKVNALYEPEDDGTSEGSNVWRSKPLVQRAQPILQSPYQLALDTSSTPPTLTSSSVRYWSDYSRLYYHPKSLIPLSEHDTNDSLMPFQNWDTGLQLFEKLEREVDLVDRDLRPFVEECDGLQGLQIFTGTDDAWGGWASGWVERLRDEFGKGVVWTWGVGEGGSNGSVPREKRLQQTINSARSLNILAEQSSVYIPATNSPAKLPKYLNMDPTSLWHVGALHCLALETMTLSSRLRSGSNGNGSLQELEAAVNGTGKRRIAKLEMSLADPDILSDNKKSHEDSRVVEKQKTGKMEKREDSEEIEGGLDEFDIDVFTQNYRVGSRGKERKEHVFARVESSRGEWKVGSGGRDPRERFGAGPVVQRYSAPLLFPLLSSFPSIVDLSSGVGSGQDHHPEKLAVYAGLTTSTAVADQVRMLEKIASRMVGVDEREALSNGLQTLAEEYDEGWDSGSEDDDE